MKSLKFILGAVIGLSSLGQIHAQETEYLNNALYVKFKENSGISAAKMGGRKVVPFKNLNLEINKQKNVSYGFHQEAASMSLFDNEILDKTFTIKFDSVEKIEEIIRMLEADPNVEYVERVPIFKTTSIETDKPKGVIEDPFYQPINGINYQWYLEMIDAEGALALQQGSPDIKLAVVDAGIWGEHPDLQIPSSNQYNSVTGVVGSSRPPEMDLDHECVTIYPSESEKVPCPQYTWSHGTHCTGLAAAKNDGKGMASLGSGTTVLAVGAYMEEYPGYAVGGYEGIQWAATQGARVISCSWGSVDEDYNNTGEQILKTCYEKNIIIVSGAGNNGQRIRFLPASSQYVLSVGSVDYNNRKSSFSNYGTWVNITCPGGFNEEGKAILSSVYGVNQRLRINGDYTFEGQYYDEKNGTSMSTPIVAGLCALMLSKNPSLTPDEIKDILQNTSTFNPENQNYFNPLAGTVNAKKAIEALDNLKFDKPVQELSVQQYQTEHARLRWKTPDNPSHEILGYRIFRDGIVIDSCHKETTYIDSIAPSGDLMYMVAVVYSDNYMSVRKEARLVMPDRFNCELYVAPANSGEVSGSGKYVAGSSVKISAIPKEGYRFIGWTQSGDTISKLANYSFFIKGDVRLYANFEEGAPSVSNETEKENTLITITPNPTHDNITIQSEVPVTHIWINNLNGQVIREIKSISSKAYEVQLSDLQSGIYIIRIKTENGISVQKVMKL